MDFGMPTLLELDSASQCAGLMRELGLNFLELNMNLPLYQPEIADVNALRQIADKYGIYYTIHLEEGLNPADINRRVADAYQKTALAAIEMAIKLGAPLLNMHLPRGVYFTLPGERVYLYDRFREQYIKDMIDFRGACEDKIGGNKIKICIENCDGFTAFHQAAIKALLKSPVFGLTLDAGHSYAAGRADEPLIEAGQERLWHMHLHDAAPDSVHLALGRGELDKRRYLTLAKNCGCRVVLETKTVSGLRESVQWLRENERE